MRFSDLLIKLRARLFRVLPSVPLHVLDLVLSVSSQWLSFSQRRAPLILTARIAVRYRKRRNLAWQMKRAVLLVPQLQNPPLTMRKF
jgi:hypothetical protein